MPARPSPASARRAALDGPLPRPSARLLARLVEAGGQGIATPAQGAAAEDLLRRGLAAKGDEARLVATAEGRSRTAREAGGVDGFLAQHAELGRGVVDVAGQPSDVLLDLDESPLAWLARRKDRDGRPLLAAHEVAAGERLRADFTRGQMTPRVTSSWEASASSGRRGTAGAGVDLADAVLAARLRVSRALAMVGPELSGALVDVCCLLKGLEAVERDRGWPQRGAKLVLGLALARLAAHYGYAAAAEGPRRSGRIERWGTPDSRPTVDGA
jgi:hypothetical protein